MKERTRGLLDIKLEYVDEIPRTSSGKLRFIISDIRD